MREGGTGLGLAIVKRIVSDHGASVKAIANQNRGTRFVIEFPSGLQITKDPNKRTLKIEAQDLEVEKNEWC